MYRCRGVEKPQSLLSAVCSSASSPGARSFLGSTEMSSSVVPWLHGGREQLLQRKMQALFNGNYCNKQSGEDVAFWQPSLLLPSSSRVTTLIYIFNLFLPKQVPPVNADLSPAAQLSISQGISAFLCRSANTGLGGPMLSQPACGHRPSSILRHCPCERRGRFQLLSAPSCHLDFFHRIFFNKMGHSPK